MELPEDFIGIIAFVYNNMQIMERSIERADIIYESYLVSAWIEGDDETCI